MTSPPRDTSTAPPDDGLRPSARAIRYGAAIAVVVVGILCGAIIPGTTGGTICTALVGLGLIGVVSLVFYDVGLTEDRDRERARRGDRAARLRLPDDEPTTPASAHRDEPRRIDKSERPRRSRTRDEHGRLP